MNVLETAALIVALGGAFGRRIFAWTLATSA
jgi:hypothetical protein